ncbi:uncharacterized protein LOC144328532 isoform X1 [Podarcis muralis]
MQRRSAGEERSWRVGGGAGEPPVRTEAASPGGGGGGEGLAGATCWGWGEDSARRRRGHQPGPRCHGRLWASRERRVGRGHHCHHHRRHAASSRSCVQPGLSQRRREALLSRMRHPWDSPPAGPDAVRAG